MKEKKMYLYINWFGIDVKALKHNFNDTPYSQSETRSSANDKIVKVCDVCAVHTLTYKNILLFYVTELDSK